ncbi:MAG: acyl carrier protein [Tetrasphaera sp.]
MPNTTIDAIAIVSTILESSCGVAGEALALAPHTPLIDLGMDSLAVLELQAKVSEHHDVELPDDAGELSLSQIADLVSAGGRR